MKLEKFKAGRFTKHSGYKAFLPSMVNNSWEWEDTKLNILLERASAEIGGLNSFADLIPNIDVYIKMHINTEANKSSRIEGTKTSIEEDLLPITDVSPEKRDDYIEVHNYINALNHGIEKIMKDDLPLSRRLILEIHRILMSGARGRAKEPGEFRRSQNWIGGTRPDNAIFVPPHVDYVGELFSDLEKFIHNDKIYVPQLIKVALLHYQFETIHPFLDGNGRIGRLLIPLYLLDKKVLDKPCFYISDYLECHRDAYYEALDRVRLKNDLAHWLRFFLEACIHTANGAKDKFKRVVALVESLKTQAVNFSGQSTNNRAILETFFDNPCQNAKEIQSSLGLTQPTVDRCIKQMLKANMLTEITGFDRNRIYLLHEYVNVFAGKGVDPLKIFVR